MQALQFLDAFLIWLSFWLADLIRNPLREALGMAPLDGSGLEHLTTLLFVIIPAVPIALEWFGFYQYPLRKHLGDSLIQMFKALVVVGFMVGIVVIVLKLPVASRLILGSTVPIAAILILCRERLMRAIVHQSVRAEDAQGGGDLCGWRGVVG